MSVTTEEAEECARGQDAIKESSQFHGYRSMAERAGATIRSLAAEREALQKRVAELEGALSSVRSVLMKAFNRVHCLPRNSDTELADKIEATLGAIRAAMERKADE